MRLYPIYPVPMVVHWVKRFTICLYKGHLSTGLMLWYICDRCLADFRNKAIPHGYDSEGNKITCSRQKKKN